MDICKVIIDLGSGNIQLEGPKEFVEKYLDKYDVLIQKIQSSKSVSPRGTEKAEAPQEEGATQRRSRTVKPKTGPSCAERIRSLIDEDYFKELRTTADVTNWLKDQKGVTYQANQVSAALNNIMKAGKLRRVKEGKGYKYCNP